MDEPDDFFIGNLWACLCLIMLLQLSLLLLFYVVVLCCWKCYG